MTEEKKEEQTDKVIDDNAPGEKDASQGVSEDAEGSADKPVSTDDAAVKSEGADTAQDADGTAETKADEKPVKPGFTPKSTGGTKPAECAACGKAFPKKMWYYRNGAFFCNSQCYKKKTEDDRKKAEEAAEKK